MIKGAGARRFYRDGTFVDARDRHRVGAHAVARDAVGGVGGVEDGGNETRPVPGAYEGSMRQGSKARKSRRT
jgi:hypothetical protein